tara:strand:+ start:680 stop:1234 length:555 start_codon:yes stop_codon:yes gene_type:complete
MIAFIGLGNVGDQYKWTKHNAGFWVINEFARRKKLVFNVGRSEYVFAKHKSKKLLLVKPTTGMNQSGIAVKSIIGKWDLLIPDIYVITDDVDLPLGSIRIRPKGGDGCHRGLENIIYNLQSNAFPRIRLGIAGKDYIRPSEKYVMKPFNDEMSIDAKIMVNRAADAMQSIITRGINRTMNQFNA